MPSPSLDFSMSNWSKPWEAWSRASPALGGHRPTPIPPGRAIREMRETEKLCWPNRHCLDMNVMSAAASSCLSLVLGGHPTPRRKPLSCQMPRDACEKKKYWTVNKGFKWKSVYFLYTLLVLEGKKTKQNQKKTPNSLTSILIQKRTKQ